MRGVLTSSNRKDLDCCYAAVPRRRGYGSASVYTVRPSETIDDSTGDLPEELSASRKAGSLYRPLFESLLVFTWHNRVIPS